MNIATLRGPMGQKPDKLPRDFEYMERVKMLPCAITGAPPPSDAHHCQHWPEDIENHPYTRLPGAGRKSGDRDTIPLSKAMHQDGPEAFHNGKETWRRKHGPDYGYIEQTRRLVEAIEEDEILGDNF